MFGGSDDRSLLDTEPVLQARTRRAYYDSPYDHVPSNWGSRRGTTPLAGLRGFREPVATLTGLAASIVYGREFLEKHAVTYGGAREMIRRFYLSMSPAQQRSAVGQETNNLYNFLGGMIRLPTSNVNEGPDWDETAYAWWRGLFNEPEEQQYEQRLHNADEAMPEHLRVRVHQILLSFPPEFDEGLLDAGKHGGDVPYDWSKWLNTLKWVGGAAVAIAVLYMAGPAIRRLMTAGAERLTARQK